VAEPTQALRQDSDVAKKAKSDGSGQVRNDPPAKATAQVDATSAATTGAAATTPRQSSGQAGEEAPKPQPFRRYDLNVTDDEAQGFINEMTRFLGGIVRRTNMILGKVSIGGFRQTFAGDLPSPDAPDLVEQNIEAAKKTLPRSHPLLALIRYAMAASRLLNRILLTTKPHLFGRPSNAFKNIMHAAEACEKFTKGKAPPEAMYQAVADSPL
jgi:hypothetical protein